MVTHNSKKRVLVIKSNNIIIFLSITSILFIFLFSIIDNDILITVQSSIENTTQTNSNNSSNQSDPTSNFTTAVQWKKFVNETIGISLEYPSNWEQDQILENRFEPKDEAYPMGEYRSGTFFELADYGEPPYEDNLEVLTRIQAAMLLDASSETFEYRIYEKPTIEKYNIDGEKAGTFKYRFFNPEFYTPLFDPERSSFLPPDMFMVEEIFVIHDSKLFNFRFHYNLGAFDYEYITKIKDHVFNSIKWVEKEKIEEKIESIDKQAKSVQEKIKNQTYQVEDTGNWIKGESDKLSFMYPNHWNVNISDSRFDNYELLFWDQSSNASIKVSDEAIKPVDKSHIELGQQRYVDVYMMFNLPLSSDASKIDTYPKGKVSIAGLPAYSELYFDKGYAILVSLAFPEGNDRHYTVFSSSPASNYDKIEPTMLEIIKSINPKTIQKSSDQDY